MKATHVVEATAHDGRESSSPQLHVAMHLVERVQTDFRVMRDAKALAEAGMKVTIVDVEKKRESRGEEVHGVHVKHVIVPGWFIPARFKPWFFIKYALVIMQSTLVLLRTDADIYHAHVEKALPACFLAGWLRRKPVIFDAPDLTLSDPTILRWRRLRALAVRLLAAMVSRCAGVITASPYYGPELRALYRASQVTVVRNMPAYREVSPGTRLRDRLGVGPQVRIVLYQGNIQANRGLDHLVRAARYLQPQVVLVLMGKASEPTASELRRLIEQEGVAQRVKLLPAVPYGELLEWTASADLGLTIFPPDYSLSIRYTLPNKLFEYLMAGVPVLSAQLEAVAEIIETYQVGAVVSSLEPQPLAAAITAMLEDREKLACMRQNALRAAREELHWEQEQQQLLRLYHEILDSSREFRGVGMHVLGVARTDGRVMRAASALAEAGYQVTVVDIETEPLPATEAISTRVQLKHVFMPRSFASRRFERGLLRKAAQVFLRSVFQLLKTNAAIYHAHDVSALPACAIAALIRRKPLVFEAHEFPLHDKPLMEMGRSRRALHWVLSVLLRYIMPRCAGVITVSPPIARKLRDFYHAPQVTVVRSVPAYREVPRTARLREALGVGPQVRIVLYQGNIQADRGLDHLVRAARYLQPQVVLVLMGKASEPTASELRRLIEQEGVAQRVKLLPAVPYGELLEWTASADLGLTIFPPDYSLNIRFSLPNKLFEYLMAGVPVLSAQLEAVAEIIAAYQVGAVVSSLEPQPLAAAITAMLEDREKLACMRQNALRAAREELHWEQEQQQLLRLYAAIEASLARKDGRMP